MDDQGLVQDPGFPRSERSASQRMAAAVAAVLAPPSTTPAVGYRAAGRYRALCAAAAQVLGVDGVSVTLISREGDSALLAANNPQAEALAELQFTTGDGPTAEVTRDGAPALAPELDDRRWPLFTPAARAAGVCAVFVIPMQLGVIRIGVACLHRRRPGPLSQPQLDALGVWLSAVLETVLNDLDKAPSVVGWLAEVDGHEATVHQATGMVLAQLGVPAEEALLRLRAHAYATGRSVADVATDVVERRLSFKERR